VILATVVLLVLHGPNGHEITLNAQQVTSLHAAIPGQPNRQFTDKTRCIVNTTDGKFISVVETCDEVSRAINEPRPRK
jgi:hypothetical protein